MAPRVGDRTQGRRDLGRSAAVGASHAIDDGVEPEAAARGLEQHPGQRKAAVGEVRRHIAHRPAVAQRRGVPHGGGAGVDGFDEVGEFAALRSDVPPDGLLVHAPSDSQDS
ncbi:hypothetical protein ASG82_25855 [Mycobacterium sp. Soil538]|nr:hypothetical protein ASG82_25855 [Mycobacterium sp. Soil538]